MLWFGMVANVLKDGLCPLGQVWYGWVLFGMVANALQDELCPLGCEAKSLAPDF